MDPITFTKQADLTSVRPTPQEGVNGASGVEQAPKRSTPEKEDVRPNAVDECQSADSEKETHEAIAKLVRGTQLEFEFEENENRVIVRVFDKESGKLLREIPPSEVVDLSRSTQHGKGRLISRSA